MANIEHSDYYKQLGDDHRFFGDLRFKQMTVWSVSTGVLINAVLSRASSPTRAFFLFVFAGIAITSIFWILEIRSTLKGVIAWEKMREIESELGARKERLGDHNWTLVNQTNAVVLLYAFSFLIWWGYLIRLLHSQRPPLLQCFASISLVTVILLIWIFLLIFTVKEYQPLWKHAKDKFRL